MSAGKLLYHLYHQPIGVFKKTFQTGLKRTAEINRGRRQMTTASQKLTEITYPGQASYNVYFLTGKKYWFQTAFCLYSLQLTAGVSIHAYIIDDGSFDDQLALLIKKQFPTTATIVRADRLQALLNEKLPEKDFPVLRRRRIEYPHLRKLTDIHILPGDGFKLVLDSDMLFFRKPDELLNWMQNPSGMLFMRDADESYGYSETLMQRLTGSAALPARLNVGVAGIKSTQINWSVLEQWTEELLKEEGSSYLQEQALTAMIAAKHPHTFLNESAYKVLPSIRGAKVPEILHHYVADTKYDYFVKGWKFLQP